MITSDMSSSFQFQSSKNWDHQYPSLYLDAKKKQKTCEEECTTLDGLAAHSLLMVIHSSTLSHIFIDKNHGFQVNEPPNNVPKFHGG